MTFTKLKDGSKGLRFKVMNKGGLVRFHRTRNKWIQWDLNEYHEKKGRIVYCTFNRYSFLWFTLYIERKVCRHTSKTFAGAL